MLNTPSWRQKGVRAHVNSEFLQLPNVPKSLFWDSEVFSYVPSEKENDFKCSFTRNYFLNHSNLGVQEPQLMPHFRK